MKKSDKLVKKSVKKWQSSEKNPNKLVKKNKTDSGKKSEKTEKKSETIEKML